MSLPKIITKKIISSLLELEKQTLRARLEYHYQMAQLCEELIVKNRVHLEVRQ